MRKIKDLLKEIKDLKKDNIQQVIIGYNKAFEIGIYNKTHLIPNEYKIANIDLYEYLTVENIYELDNLSQAFLTLDDIGKVDKLNDRINVYYKNGKKATTVFIRNWNF